MNKITLIFVATTAIAMFGCASPYVGPTSGSTAMLTLPVSTQKWNPNEHQGIAIAPKKDDGCGELSKGITPDTFEKDMTVKIVADTDILFSVWRMWNPMFCANIFGQFHANKDYEYILNLDTVGRSCVVSIIGKSPDGTLTPIKATRAYMSKIAGNKICDSKDKITGYSF